MCIYIYIYRERERQRDVSVARCLRREFVRELCACGRVHTSTCICVHVSFNPGHLSVQGPSSDDLFDLERPVRLAIHVQEDNL